MLVAKAVTFIAPIVVTQQRHVAAYSALSAYSFPDALADERTLRLAFRSAALAASAPIQRRGYSTATRADSQPEL
jgi:hypothetical protein